MSNEYISISSAFKEKLIIQKDSIQYSFSPIFDKTTAKKWKYKSNNKNYFLKYELLCDLIGGLSYSNIKENKKILSIKMIDNNKCCRIINVEKSNDTIQMIISIIKELLPSVEVLPIC